MRPVRGTQPEALRRGDIGALAQREADHIEAVEQFLHLGALEAFLMQLVARPAEGSLEQRDERPSTRLSPQVERRLHEVRLVVKPIACCLPGYRSHVVGKRKFLLHASSHIIQHGRELVWRVIAVEARNDRSSLVEEQQRRRELDVEEPRELLLAHAPAVHPGHLAVTPNVQCDRDEVLARLAHDGPLREIDLHQPLAIGATFLAEIRHHALA